MTSERAAAVLREVLGGEGVRLRRILGQRLGGRERSCVGGRLRVALLAEPRADVEDEGHIAEQSGEEEDGEDHGLATFVAKGSHSTRSVVVLFRLPGRHDQPQQADLVRVLRLDRHVGAVLPVGTAIDGDVELRLVEVGRRRRAPSPRRRLRARPPAG